MNGKPPDYDALRWLADRLEPLLRQLAGEADRMTADRVEPAYVCGWLRSGVGAALAYVDAARRTGADDPAAR